MLEIFSVLYQLAAIVTPLLVPIFLATGITFFITGAIAFVWGE